MSIVHPHTMPRNTGTLLLSTSDTLVLLQPSNSNLKTFFVSNTTNNNYTINNFGLMMAQIMLIIMRKDESIHFVSHALLCMHIVMR